MNRSGIMFIYNGFGRICGNWKTITKLLLSIVVAAAALSCDSQQKQQVVKVDDEEVFSFDVYTLTNEDIVRDIDGLGNLAIFDKATVISRIDGIVENVFVKKGDMVDRGDRIIELSNYQLALEKIKIEKEVLSAQEELDTVKIQYMEEEKNLYKKFYILEKMKLQIENSQKEIQFSKANLARKRILFDKGGITQEELRNIEFSLESKEGELKVLKKGYELESYGFRNRDLILAGYSIPNDEEKRRKLLVSLNTRLLKKRIEFARIRLKKEMIELERVDWLLEQMVITAPIGGVVTDVIKFVGEKLNADETVTTILNQNRLIARVSFSETDRQGLSGGEEVSVFIDSLGINIPGLVYAIDPYIDVNTRRFNVDCVIENTLNLVPGMFVRVRIPVKKVEHVLLLPKNALIQEDEQSGSVYVVSKNDRIFRRNVLYEGYDDRFVIVRDGVREDEIVVIKPLINLMDGMRITYRKK